MPAWTPAERRGALLVALLLSLGAARDLWRASHPRMTSAPAEVAEGPAGPAGGPASAPPGAPGPAVAGASATVDLNEAGAAELDALPGIGPVLAGRILQHRSAHGPFREPEDLLACRASGRASNERLRPRIRVGRPGREGPAPRTATGPPASLKPLHSACPRSAGPRADSGSGDRSARPITRMDHDTQVHRVAGVCSPNRSAGMRATCCHTARSPCDPVSAAPEPARAQALRRERDRCRKTIGQLLLEAQLVDENALGKAVLQQKSTGGASRATWSRSGRSPRTRCSSSSRALTARPRST